MHSTLVEKHKLSCIVFAVWYNILSDICNLINILQCNIDNKVKCNPGVFNVRFIKNEQSAEFVLAEKL